MHRGLTAGEQDAIRPVLERIRVWLPHLGLDDDSAECGTDFEDANQAIETGEWAVARRMLEACSARLAELKQDARAKKECERADMLMRSSLLLEAKKKLCLFFERWDDGYFGDAWQALVTARMSTSGVARNGDGEVAVRWDDLLGECEHRFPPIVGFSVAGEAVSARCSICAQDVLSCSHITGRIYCGVLCSREIVEMDLREVSIVKDPAQPAARVLKIGSLDVGRVGLFWDEGEGDQ